MSVCCNMFTTLILLWDRISNVLIKNFFFFISSHLIAAEGFCGSEVHAHGDDLVEHRTREACFGAKCTNHSANMKNKKTPSRDSTPIGKQ